MNELHTGYLQKHKDILTFRELADSTIKNYTTYLTRFLEWAESELACQDVKDISWEQIRSYITYLRTQCGLNSVTVNVHIAQMRDFFEYVLHRTWDRHEVPTLRCDQKLPIVPTFDQVNIIIDSIQNPKHKAEIALLYSSGIRACELCRLRCGDIQTSQSRIYISVSKNRHDRYAVLSHKALELLIIYIRSSYPGASKGDWLFPGHNPGEHITEESVRMVFKRALSDLGWDDKGFNLHSLRHAFGLHLYLSGVDLMTIKEAMGHKSLRSTEIYLTLGIGNGRSVMSPYDRSFR